MDKLIKRIENNLKKSILLKKTKILVAVSAGADSMTLVHWLMDLQDQGLVSIHLGYYHHGIIPNQSDGDVQFLDHFSQKNKLPFYYGKGDVPQYAKTNRLSIEQAARKLRYQFLVQTAIQHDCVAILTAHHLNDVVETQLMHLFQGTGLKGLSGVANHLTEYDIPIIRPMLDITKSEINQFVKKQQIQYRMDQSNSDIQYLRNKVRCDWVPWFEKNWKHHFYSSFQKLSRIVQEDELYLENQTTKLYLKICICQKNQVIVKKTRFFKEPLALQRRLIQKIFQKFIQGQSISLNQITRVIQLLQENISSRQWSFNLNLKLIDEKKYFLLRKEIVEQSYPKSIDLDLTGEERKTVFQDLFLEIKTQIVDKVKIKSDPFKTNWQDLFQIQRIEYLNLKSIQKPLYLGFRVQGLKYQPIGFKHHQSLKKMMIDQKIPNFIKNQLPIIFAGDDVLCPIGFRIADFAKISMNTQKILKCSYIWKPFYSEV